jgi:hypothetical protein
MPSFFGNFGSGGSKGGFSSKWVWYIRNI